jgi:hypothetical protein
VPPEPRLVPRFAAEPPQEGLPYGRRAQRLAKELLKAWSALGRAGEGEDVGEPGELVWYPDRTWNGLTYIPASAHTSTGYEMFGFVRFAATGAQTGQNWGEPDDSSGHGDDDRSPFFANPPFVQVDFTEQTAERNPGWRLDLCEQAIGSWRGLGGGVATMTLVWGRPLLGGGRMATAELGGVTVDQCELVEQRFTLIAPDDYQHDLLEVVLWGAKGQELARESLYEG